MSDPSLLIRLAEDDDDFILALVPRFVDFPLPAWRRRHECIEGIRDELLRHLEDQPANSHLFVAEDADGTRVGFIHLQRTEDFFTGRSNCHIPTSPWRTRTKAAVWARRCWRMPSSGHASTTANW